MEKNAGGFPGKKNTELVENISDQDRFYEMLCKLNQPSGLSLVFNLRDTKLDLLRFYEEVIKRGGFYQVTKHGKWDEVASASSLSSSVTMSASQLRNVYELLLFQYELMHCPKNPGGRFSCSGSLSAGKRKEASEPNPMQKKSNVKEFVMDGDAPQKPRTGYHIFLKLEANRLRMTHGESSNSLNTREMAIQAWRCLPEKQKQQYIEASKMDKKRYEKEMAAYKQLQKQHNVNESQISVSSNQAPSKLKLCTSLETDDVKQLQKQHNVPESQISVASSNQAPSKLNLSTYLETDDVYHVSLEADHESNADLKIDLVTKNAASGSVGVPYPMNDDWDYFNI